jgi:2-keto-4-pentenoate hydratase/2-oxohepta-3-ene-1,7-dioic acid hydratase in catechol pathway
MRFVTFSGAAGPEVGVVASDETIVRLSELRPGSPSSLVALIEEGPEAWRDVAERSSGRGGGTPVARSQLLAPIPEPRRNVMCVGWNYAEHFEEGKAGRGANAPTQIPEHPALFSKNPACVIGHDANILDARPHSDQLDWEAELAIVIGRKGRDIEQANAMAFVFGYTIANDVSVRDIQRQWHGGQWFKGKNFDTHLPLGPCVATTDEIRDPHRLDISSRVNGATMQAANTRDMVFKIPRIIAELSAGMTLRPGDIVLTGTPSGVGMGRTPPVWLHTGDVVEVEIEGIGILRNRVAARS